jgi:hypothetical protein
LHELLDLPFVLALEYNYFRSNIYRKYNPIHLPLC